MEKDPIQELTVAIERLSFQVGRLVSDFDSEKGIAKERNKQYNERLENIEAWKNKWNGALIAMSIIVMALTIIGFVMKFK